MNHAGKLNGLGDSIVAAAKNGMRQSEIARRYGVTGGAIHYTLKKHGVQSARPGDNLNRLAFDEVTPQSAYWIGFLMADGCVRHGTRNRGALQVRLKASDVGHLRKLKRFLNSHHAISDEPPKRMIIKGRPTGNTGCACVAITCRQLVDSLAKYGIVPRKTNSARVLLLEEDRHFWRGVVDGDGSIARTRAGSFYLHLTGAPSLLEQFAAFVQTAIPFWRGRLTENMSWRRQFSVSGRVAVSLIRHLYEDCDDYLDRKMGAARRIIALSRITGHDRPQPSAMGRRHPVPTETLGGYADNSSGAGEVGRTRPR